MSLLSPAQREVLEKLADAEHSFPGCWSHPRYARHRTLLKLADLGFVTLDVGYYNTKAQITDAGMDYAQSALKLFTRDKS